MRKSSLAVPLTILTAIAAGACDDDPPGLQHCVNADGVVVDEANCADAGDRPLDSNGNPIPGRSGFFWYYGGGTRYYPGNRIIIGGGGSYRSGGGSYVSPGGHYSSGPSVGVGRGGFGSVGGAHGGGEGAGG